MRVWSKGLGADGLVFKMNDRNLSHNSYMRVLFPGYADSLAELASAGDMVMLFGETFGPGVQDLSYGMTEKGFRAFDLRVDGEFVDHDEMVSLVSAAGFDLVPELFRGPFDLEPLMEVANGLDTLSESHVREGVVIKTVTESRHPIRGRRIAKIVSMDYKTRKGGTEHN